MSFPAVRPLPSKMSAMVLQRYFERFLDPERLTPGIHLMLNAMQRRKGYGSSSNSLWNYLHPSGRERIFVISERTLASYSYKLSEVLVYWDYAYTGPESPFPRNPLVSTARYGEISACLDHCPPDLYIFDASMEWTLIRTSGEQNDLGWTCFQIGPIGQ